MRVFFALVVIKFLNVMSHRVLIALIRNNGNCPCPRCLVLKSNIPMMGGKRDLKNRVTSKRLDNAAHRKVIESAWTLVYNRNYSVNSVAVDRLLTDKSLVPTRVGLIIVCPLMDNCLTISRTHSPLNLRTWDLTSSKHSWSILCMNLNSECGKACLFI